MTDVQILKQRRIALDTELVALREHRERASREHSYAGSRQRAGITDHNAATMKDFADAEVAGDSDIADLRRRIESIDTELADVHGGRVAEAGRRVLSWLGK